MMQVSVAGSEIIVGQEAEDECEAVIQQIEHLASYLVELPKFCESLGITVDLPSSDSVSITKVSSARAS
jgi:DNA polymerase II small subunit/DNA polymerase delta subunit B